MRVRYPHHSCCSLSLRHRKACRCYRLWRSEHASAEPNKLQSLQSGASPALAHCAGGHSSATTQVPVIASATRRFTGATNFCWPGPVACARFGMKKPSGRGRQSEKFRCGSHLSTFIGPAALFTCSCYAGHQQTCYAILLCDYRFRCLSIDSLSPLAPRPRFL